MKPIDPSGLKPYQGPASETLLRALLKHGAAIDGSDMGIGKTYQAGAVIRAMEMPTLVVGPKISRTDWLRMGQHLGVGFDYINYEMLRTGRTPYGHWRDDGHFEFSSAIHNLVFDEVHRCGGISTQQSKMLIAAKRQRIFTTALSATIGDSPASFCALGYLLGLHSLVDIKQGLMVKVPGFRRWAKINGCYVGDSGGVSFNRSDEERRLIMAKIHAKIFPERGCRISVKDVPDFPERQIFADLYDLAEKNLVDQLWAEMAEAMEELRSRCRGGVSESYPLVRILRARQKLELLKVPIFEALARDATAQGYSVVIFTNFTQTLDEICRRLNIKCRIDGTQIGEKGARARQDAIDTFQRNDERLLATNIDCGGVSISMPDLDGNHPRLGLVFPGFSATKMRQAFGRLHRTTSKSKCIYRVVFAADTVEQQVYRNVSRKLNCLDALQDGDLLADNLRLTPAEFENFRTENVPPDGSDKPENPDKDVPF